MENLITKFQKECWANYKDCCGIPQSYAYLWGNPVKVHIPIDTAQNGIMIIGAYPTAHFNTIKGVRDVPVEDHLYPFSNEHYFDGSTVRSVKSGEELDKYYLKPLDSNRDECWITDLVKVFLFKEGHIKKYHQLGFNGYLLSRSKFREIAVNSLKYIHEEIKLAQPKIILTLGSEVAGSLMGISEKKAIKLMTKFPVDYKVGNKNYKLFALPHPGIIMRNSRRSEVWKRVLQKQISQIKKILHE